LAFGLVLFSFLDTYDDVWGMYQQTINWVLVYFFQDAKSQTHLVGFYRFNGRNVNSCLIISIVRPSSDCRGDEVGIVLPIVTEALLGDGFARSLPDLGCPGPCKKRAVRVLEMVRQGVVIMVYCFGLSWSFFRLVWVSW
jgi:hypothetical protein